MEIDKTTKNARPTEPDQGLFQLSQALKPDCKHETS